MDKHPSKSEDAAMVAQELFDPENGTVADVARTVSAYKAYDAPISYFTDPATVEDFLENGSREAARQMMVGFAFRGEPEKQQQLMEALASGVKPAVGEGTFTGKADINGAGKRSGVERS